ncbi:hypothetical protein JTE90_016910 [Oedothorax gibbosus]|uniref:C2H2-type domain-containing protein n=1 Tax=Oedothorax gibbosus TaxID=931172 RepID=A0AAV6USX6_9ARAC|nr:hypothetical protein JTE90_016910 [Oedothorax gibbosus]
MNTINNSDIEWKCSRRSFTKYVYCHQVRYLATSSISVIPNNTGIIATLSRHRCVTCTKTFHSSYNLNRHMKTHEATKKPSMVNDGASTSRAQTLVVQNVVSSPTTVYSCITCSKSFAQKHNLTRHIKSHEIDTSYSCPICDKTYSRKDALDRHMKMRNMSALSVRRLSPGRTR